ncbi:nuclease-related domain-containing protein [Rheinheimera sp. MMS21-TC3]|uniref:nuclease-related domain-containing protein n=1 Tax=Rheinheimera sp. MMS21-TC3 TaxID=3072790 RepID=UPI0028C45B26|nr:nuclease-related domain-containing protein [Rheinheimera sp. MMS21-TC3]WNO61031.1 nuclease-related domain-containing protein [Rheinheimera sp. MMS21-TC3]
MILKEKTQTISSSAKLDAGIKQEQDVAFYLRRAYKDRDNVMVINDLRIEHDGEVAQIDHLIVYSYGFIVVESKSIRGEVSVNEHGEWSRSYKGQWSGMPSPIKQAELQLKLLKQYLCANTLQVIGKFLGIQQGLGARCYDVFCAISSDAIIDRANATKEVADKLVKSEFIADALDKKMNFIKFYRLVAKTFDTRPSFNSDELMRISGFLLGEPTTQANHPVWPIKTNTDKSLANTNKVNLTSSDLAKPRQPDFSRPVASQQITPQCKHCGNQSALTAHSGRYGYYVQCGSCGGNTALKRPCMDCGSGNTKVSKSRQLFRLICKQCNQQSIFSIRTGNNHRIR